MSHKTLIWTPGPPADDVSQARFSIAMKAYHRCLSAEPGSVRVNRLLALRREFSFYEQKAWQAVRSKDASAFDGFFKANPYINPAEKRHDQH